MILVVSEEKVSHYQIFFRNIFLPLRIFRYTLIKHQMKKEQVFREFNEKGIFPSDAVLNEIAKSHPNEYDDAFDVEHEMIMIAFNDANHPYHLTRVYPYHHLMRVNNPPVFTINTKDLSITEEMPHKAPMDSHKMGPSYTD